jgi:hypothetical protein
VTRVTGPGRGPAWFVLVAGVWVATAAACVTRTTVCVETSHGVGPARDGYRPDSVGASVCAEVERP